MIPLNALIIEDSESDSALVVRVLEKAGYEVYAKRVENKADVKTAIESHDWDVILADYQLPQFNASVALDILQDSGLDIPFIVVSGAIGEEIAVSLMKSGACDYVLKNNLSKLPAIIERELIEKQIRLGRIKDFEVLRLQSAALNSAANSILITDRDGTITWTNSAFTTLTGYSISEALGKNPRDLVKSGYHDQLFYQEMWQKIGGGEIWQGEIINKRKDGSLYNEELTITPLRGSDGIIRNFIAIKQDITARKKMEKEIKQWADAFQNCAHGIAMVNPDTDQIIVCNPSFARLYGDQVKNLVEKNMFDLFADEEREKVTSSVTKSDQNGRAQYDANLIRKDKSVIPIQMDIVSVRDANKKLLYRVSTMQDICARKKAEQLLVEKMQERKKRAHELEVITSISSAMRQAETQADLEKVILKKLTGLMGAQCATIAFLDNSTLFFSQATGGVKIWDTPIIRSDSGIFGDVIRTGTPIFIEQFDSSVEQRLPGWIEDHFPNLNSAVIFPLKSGASNIGTVFVGFINAFTFEREHQNFVQTVSEMAGNALKRMSTVEKLNLMISHRDRELECIYQVTSSASRTLDIALALQEALTLIVQTVNANFGAIYLLGENSCNPELFVHYGNDYVSTVLSHSETMDNLLNRVVCQKKPVVMPDMAEYDKQTFIGFPMRAQDRVIGTLVMIRKGEEQVIIEEMTLLSFIADHLALIIENTKLFKETEQAAIQAERSRLSRELHDSITQLLYSANLISAGAQNYATQQNYKEVDSCLKQIDQLSRQALRDMRLLIYELRSPELATIGLIGALQARLDAVERRLNIDANIEGMNYSPSPERIEKNLYWIAIEGLNNSLKHAHADKVSLTLNCNENNISLAIQDNGVGFNPDTTQHSGGIGLLSMHERAEQLGGIINIDSKPGSGCRIEVCIPLPEYAENK